MHERSETVQKPNGKWVNVYGRGTLRAGQPLTPKHFFEKAEYPTVKEAVDAARQRSQQEPDYGDPVSPLFPFQRPPSNLPSGVSLTPKGDLGKSRGKEAKAAGGFSGAKIMDTKRYFR